MFHLQSEGADGVHSRVREKMIGAEDAAFTGRVAYRTVMPGDYPGKPDLDPNGKRWDRTGTPSSTT